MTEKKDKTKKDLEKAVEALTASNQEQLLQLQQLSAGYQAAVHQAQQLNMLVNRYEETINLLTSRLIESRAQPLSSAEDSQN
jgi:hypothetical protein